MDLVTHKFVSTTSAAAAALSPIKSPPHSFFGPTVHTSHTSFPIIAVAVIGILATAFLLVGYYIFVIKCCLNWHRIDLLRRFSHSRRRRPAEDRLMAYSPAVQNRGLNESAIRSIPILKFKKSDAASDANSCECAVCLNEFQDGDKLRSIPNCGHAFHIDCIDIWLQNNANCPLCRTSISARPELRLPAVDVLGPGPDQQGPNTSGASLFNGRDEDYVVIEIGDEARVANPSLHEETASNELFSRKTMEAKTPSRKKAKKLSHIASMGDEVIDNRQKDKQFLVQPIRRSFSMDSAADSQLHLVVQEIIQRHGHVNNTNDVNQIEGCSSSRVRRSFFSFGQGKGSRNAVQPLALEPRG